MGDEQKPKIENLELNRETLQDLSQEQSEEARGGLNRVVGDELNHYSPNCQTNMLNPCVNPC